MSEELRQAAALMRARAEAATPGPWRFTDSEAVNDVWEGGMAVVNPHRDPIANVQDEWYENDPGEPAPINDAEHIASWHPLVALAVADSLIAAAAHIESYECEAHCEPDGCDLVLTATRTARTYLGSAS